MENGTNTTDRRAFQLLVAVDETVRQMGGRHLLTAEEYLEIVNECYRRIYKNDEDDRPSEVATH